MPCPVSTPRSNLMERKPSVKNLRRPKGHVSSLATSLIHLRHPWVTAWWSAAFPGFGHISLGSYIKGFLLIIWEIVINVNANINTAIMYSFTGRFDLAREVLNERWLILYLGVYIYAIWDTYRSTVDLNKFTILAERDDTTITPFALSTFEINYFDKRNPWVAVAWSILMPGLGHLYTHRLPTGFFVLAWWIAITYMSHLLEAVHYTFTGSFSQATAMLDPLWLLFMPSLYGFAVHDAYTNTVEYNKLFDVEQSSFLKEEYQHPDFKLPLK